LKLVGFGPAASVQMQQFPIELPETNISSFVLPLSIA
jgi:hypothetical protein